MPLNMGSWYSGLSRFKPSNYFSFTVIFSSVETSFEVLGRIGEGKKFLYKNTIIVKLNFVP